MAGRARAPKVDLEELLLRHGAIDEAQLGRARQEQKNLGGELGRVLVDLGFISEELLMRALAHQLEIPRVEPDTMAIATELLQALPVQLCERFGVIAVGSDPAARTLRVATHDPSNAKHLATLSAASGYRIEPAAATTASIERAIRRHYYGEGQPVARATDATGGPGPAAEAAEAPSAPAAQPIAATGELASVLRRVERLEGMRQDPQFAAVLARLERLEQLAASEVQVLRAVGEILVESGLVTREDYLKRAGLEARAKAKAEKAGASKGPTSE